MVEEEKKQKVENKKEKSILDKLSDGNWIDRLTGSWGKPKSYNKDWNKGEKDE